MIAIEPVDPAPLGDNFQPQLRIALNALTHDIEYERTASVKSFTISEQSVGIIAPGASILACRRSSSSACRLTVTSVSKSGRYGQRVKRE